MLELGDFALMHRSPDASLARARPQLFYVVQICSFNGKLQVGRWDVGDFGAEATGLEPSAFGQVTAWVLGQDGRVETLLRKAGRRGLLVRHLTLPELADELRLRRPDVVMACGEIVSVEAHWNALISQLSPLSGPLSIVACRQGWPATLPDPPAQVVSLDPTQSYMRWERGLLGIVEGRTSTREDPDAKPVAPGQVAQRPSISACGPSSESGSGPAAISPSGTAELRRDSGSSAPTLREATGRQLTARGARWMRGHDASTHRGERRPADASSDSGRGARAPFTSQPSSYEHTLQGTAPAASIASLRAFVDEATQAGRRRSRSPRHAVQRVGVRSVPAEVTRTLPPWPGPLRSDPYPLHQEQGREPEPLSPSQQAVAEVQDVSWSTERRATRSKAEPAQVQGPADASMVQRPSQGPGTLEGSASGSSEPTVAACGTSPRLAASTPSTVPPPTPPPPPSVHLANVGEQAEVTASPAVVSLSLRLWALAAFSMLLTAALTLFWPASPPAPVPLKLETMMLSGRLAPAPPPAPEPAAGSEPTLLALAAGAVDLGHGLLRASRAREAMVEYRRALAAVPNYPRALTGMVRAYLELKDGEKASYWAERLVKRQASVARNHRLHGDALRMQGQEREAAAAYRRAVRLGDKVAARRLRQGQRRKR